MILELNLLILQEFITSILILLKNKLYNLCLKHFVFIDTIVTRGENNV